VQHQPTEPELRVRVGVFRDLELADAAVDRLIAAGIPKDSISVICPSCSPEHYDDVNEVEPAGARTPKAAAAGGAIGTVLGGLTAAAGIAATGGLGLLAAGPLLLGAAGGGVVGGFIGAMSTRGFEPEIADFYDQALRRGSILVSVESEHENDLRLVQAERILESAGAEPMSLPMG
jgi:hypothetical protein